MSRPEWAWLDRVLKPVAAQSNPTSRVEVDSPPETGPVDERKEVRVMTEQDWRELMVRYDAFGEPPVRDKPKDECQCFSCGMARGMRKAEDAHCSCTCHDGKWNWMCKLHGMND